MKDIKYYMDLNYPVTIDKFEEFDGEIKYSAEITDLPGCSTHGKTPEEALAKLEEAKISWLEVSLERKLTIPEPVTEDQFSGKFLLRIPSRLHKQLTLRAAKEEMSLNQYIRNILEKNVEQDLLAVRLEEYMYQQIQELRKDFFAKLIRLTTYVTSSELMFRNMNDVNRASSFPVMGSVQLVTSRMQNA